MKTQYKVDICVFLFYVLNSFSVSITICLRSIYLYECVIVGKIEGSRRVISIDGGYLLGFVLGCSRGDFWNYPLGFVIGC